MSRIIDVSLHVPAAVLRLLETAGSLAAFREQRRSALLARPGPTETTPVPIVGFPADEQVAVLAPLPDRAEAIPETAALPVLADAVASRVPAGTAGGSRHFRPAAPAGGQQSSLRQADPRAAAGARGVRTPEGWPAPTERDPGSPQAPESDPTSSTATPKWSGTWERSPFVTWLDPEQSSDNVPAPAAAVSQQPLLVDGSQSHDQRGAQGLPLGQIPHRSAPGPRAVAGARGVRTPEGWPAPTERDPGSPQAPEADPAISTAAPSWSGTWERPPLVTWLDPQRSADNFPAPTAAVSQQPVTTAFGINPQRPLTGGSRALCERAAPLLTRRRRLLHELLGAVAAQGLSLADSPPRQADAFSAPGAGGVRPANGWPAPAAGDARSPDFGVPESAPASSAAEPTWPAAHGGYQPMAPVTAAEGVGQRSPATSTVVSAASPGAADLMGMSLPPLPGSNRLQPPADWSTVGTWPVEPPRYAGLPATETAPGAHAYTGRLLDQAELRRMLAQIIRTDALRHGLTLKER